MTDRYADSPSRRERRNSVACVAAHERRSAAVVRQCLICAAAAAVVAIAVNAAGAGEHAVGAVAAMTTASGEDAGTVTLTEGPNGVLIEADLKGLTPGEHGFHIHETGSCEDGFKAAGGHFNPEDEAHGLMFEGGHHVGDLPNIFVAEDGTAKAHSFTHRARLGEDEDGMHSLTDADGSAIIVHENADTYGEDAGAGGRIACGVIEAGGS